MADENLTPRVPPHSEEAEQSVLGSMLMDRDAVNVAVENLSQEDFYNLRHGEIFGAMVDLYHENRAVDLVTLKNQLEQKGKLEAAGDMKYLSQIAAAVPNSVHIKNYVQIVKDKSLYRKFIQLGNQVMAEGYSTETPIDVLSEEVEQKVFRILQNKGNEDFSHIRDVLLETFDDIERIAKSEGEITGIPTGFVDLDYRTSGLQPSDLVLVGARPSMGKTAFALNVVQHAAVRKHKCSAIFSLEMSKKQLVNRMLSCEAGVESEKLRSGKLEDSDWEKLAMALAPLSEAPIYIDDTPGITLAEMRSKCRKLKLDKGLDLIMIDYLQLMSGSGRNGDNRQQEISDISRGLKALAREMQAPVVALSQLSRALEARADHRPMLSDLRESGAIEQDADVVMFLYRDEYYHPETEDKNIAEIIIAKQRNGPTGTVKLAWLGQYTKFANLQF
ncbi:replicative DNA helicase [Bianquea renquensis]|jgi:replicative DNA helicase|uniref:Replicative DNA helicase n=1 Tax=Bianquea renquensis TaxID=2763661 RepID=A0A926I2S4_9FIRM|nr:replicative DNA helicase [Bianquea renquensis]MBC8544386.1 replicative DNA helicase [Bianquea renquensis]